MRQQPCQRSGLVREKESRYTTRAARDATQSRVNLLLGAAAGAPVVCLASLDLDGIGRPFRADHLRTAQRTGPFSLANTNRPLGHASAASSGTSPSSEHGQPQPQPLKRSRGRAVEGPRKLRGSAEPHSLAIPCRSPRSRSRRRARERAPARAARSLWQRPCLPRPPEARGACHRRTACCPTSCRHRSTCPEERALAAARQRTVHAGAGARQRAGQR